MGKRNPGRYDDYRGQKKFGVSHPDYGSTAVTAPDETSAMVAAAKVWNTRWTRTDFYLRCEVYKL